MSGDIQSLRSYLVELGFNVNNPQLQQFNAALESAARRTKGITGNIAGDITKWQMALSGFFLATGASIVAVMDRVAQADLKFKLMGERMMMTTSRARSFSLAVDALGGNMGAIAFDPELHGRFNQLMADQNAMGKGLGGDYESNMRKIRDVRFEFTRLSFELKYGLMSTVNQVFKAFGFGSGDLVIKLRQLNTYIIEHIPEWSRMIAKYVVPFLKDVRMIAKDVWEIVKELAAAFSNFIGIISGDKSLQGAANMDKFAGAVQKVTHWLALALHYSLKLFGLFAGAGAGAAVGASIGSVVPGVGTAAGGLVGALAGGVIGNLAQMVGHAANGSSRGNSGASVSGSGSVSERARQVALAISAKTGISPAILYAQFAHETGNFNNRGSNALHNFAGINNPGSQSGMDYRDFGSDASFVNYYSKLLQGRYKGALGSQTPEAFAAALKSGGYYGDSLRNYTNGMRSHMGDFAKGAVTNQVTVNVKTNANPHEIAQAVSSTLDNRAQADRQRVLIQMAPAYS